MERNAVWACVLAASLLFGGAMLALIVQAPIHSAIDTVATERGAPDCRPRDARGKDCYQHLTATVTTTSYDSDGVVGVWSAEATLSDGTKLDEILGPISDSTKAGDTFPAILYNGRYLYIEGYRPWVHEADDAFSLHGLVTVFTASLLAVLYGLVVLFSLAMANKLITIDVWASLRYRASLVLCSLLGICIGSGLLFGDGTLYTGVIVWLLPWLLVAIGAAIELTIAWRLVLRAV
jgi:hypothetical protein